MKLTVHNAAFWPHAAVGLVNCRPAKGDPLRTARNTRIYEESRRTLIVAGY
jgi:hypothetical protein